MWHEATIRGILRNLTYTGVLRSGDAHSQVIPELQIISEKDVNDTEIILKDLSDSFDELISWAELYDEASFEKKKMIVNCLIKRVDVCRDYKLKIDFNFNFEQFVAGLDKTA